MTSLGAPLSPGGRRQVVEAIAADAIDILVDLTGHWKQARTRTIAHRRDGGAAAAQLRRVGDQLPPPARTRT